MNDALLVDVLDTLENLVEDEEIVGVVNDPGPMILGIESVVPLIKPISQRVLAQLHLEEEDGSVGRGVRKLKGIGEGNAWGQNRIHSL